MNKKLDRYRAPLTDRRESQRYLGALNGKPVPTVERARDMLREVHRRTTRRS